MGEQSHLLDSNVVIYIEKGISDSAVLDFLTIATVDGSLISVATEIGDGPTHRLGFAFASPAALQRMEELVADATVLPLDQTVARKAVEIRRQRKIKLGDAIIAATALVYDLILVTNNTDDFKGITGLTLANPFAVP